MRSWGGGSLYWPLVMFTVLPTYSAETVRAHFLLESFFSLLFRYLSYIFISTCLYTEYFLLYFCDISYPYDLVHSFSGIYKYLSCN